MIRNGATPHRLFKKLAGKVLVKRQDLLKINGVAAVDRAMARLVREGMVDKLDRGLWLIPTGLKPRHDIPRAWSNPGLTDPDTIIALTLVKPTLPDLTRTVMAFGIRRAERVLSELEHGGEISSGRAAADRHMLINIRLGLVRSVKPGGRNAEAR